MYMRFADGVSGANPNVSAIIMAHVTGLQAFVTALLDLWVEDVNKVYFNNL